MLPVTLRLFFALTLTTGVIYPLVVTVFAQVLFHTAANGSFLTVKDKVIGSRYIGQQFTDKKYFWPRPSAVDYLPMPSGGSNLGPINPKLKEQMKERAAKIMEMQPGSTLKTIPSELLYASGSGVDPNISLEAALFQLDRVAAARNLSGDAKDQLRDMIKSKSKRRLDRFLTIPYVNVLELNIALDGLK